MSSQWRLNTPGARLGSWEKIDTPKVMGKILEKWGLYSFFLLGICRENCELVTRDLGSVVGKNGSYIHTWFLKAPIFCWFLLV